MNSGQAKRNENFAGYSYVSVVGLESRKTSLPTYHKDPFDRILIAQAKAESMVIASADPIFSKYEIEVMWE